MNFRKATSEDLTEINVLIKDAISNMERQNIHQWDEIYPAAEDFKNDFESKNLFVGTKYDEIAVVYVVSRDFDDEYNKANWQFTDGDFRIIHRLCVNPKFQNQGIAKKTLGHIENELKSQNIKSIRLDVFSENPYALSLYEKSGYKKAGSANWRKGMFFLLEKDL